MKQEEITVRGIIIAVYSQGEYGKRISLLSDTFGKITVFAQGAAKQNSRIIGACRPFVCGEFTLAGGKSAWNMRGIKVIESFEEIPVDPDKVFTGSYILEFASYFSEEEMDVRDAKDILNLMYVTLKALKESEMPPELIRRIFELRMLVHEGIYTEKPCEDTEECIRLWEYVLRSPLSALFKREVWKAAGEAGGTVNGAGNSFIYSVKHLRNTQVEHRFKSEELLL